MKTGAEYVPMREIRPPDAPEASEDGVQGLWVSGLESPIVMPFF